MGLNETGTSMKTVRALRKDKAEHVDAPAESRKKAVAEDEANAGRRLQIMTEAARLFATRGFDATKIRDIAAAAGILGGSIYYHFASKEEIFLAVHSAGMETISSRPPPSRIAKRCFRPTSFRSSSRPTSPSRSADCASRSSPSAMPTTG
jgi:hypothetical protein